MIFLVVVEDDLIIGYVVILFVFILIGIIGWYGLGLIFVCLIK